MKAFKKLFSIVLAVAMILSMSVTAFATNGEGGGGNPVGSIYFDDDGEGGNTGTTPTGQITVMNPGTETYRAYKIFDATTVTDATETTVKYTIASDSPWLSVVYDTTNNTSNIAGLTFTSTEGGYIVTKGPGFTAENLASVLKANIPNTTSFEFDPVTYSASNLADGYYLVVAKDGTDDQERAMLVTVLNGEEAKIQNKNDMPLDKTVDGVKTEGVQVGQTLHFEINGKVPEVGEEDTFYAYYVSDIMDEGLAFDEGSFSVIIPKGGTQFQTYTAEEVGYYRWHPYVIGYSTFSEYDDVIYGVTSESEEIPFVLVETDENTGVRTYYALDPEGNKIEVPTITYDELTVENGGLTEISVPNTTLSGDQVRFDENGKTFELSLDMISRREFAGQPIVITYNATVTEDAVARVEENWAILEYGNNPEHLEIKDSKTKVYDSQIIIDKFETDAPERKLAGAKFILKRVKDAEGNSAEGYYKEVSYKTYERADLKILDVDYSVGGTDDEPIYTSINDPQVTYSRSEIHVEGEDYEVEAGTYYALKNGERVVSGISFVNNEDDATVKVTDSDGIAKFIGLPDGKYELIETEAPVDYTILQESITVVIENGDCITPGLSADEAAMMLTETVSVNNTIGSNLPSTGGIGTTIFYVVGAILVIAGGVVLVTRRRMSA